MINSLARGLQILSMLAESDVPLGVTEVAERLGVDPSTSYRLLATLENHRFVLQETNKKYALGFGILDIAAGLNRRLNLAAVAMPSLTTLTKKSGETSHIAIAVGTSAVFVAQVLAPGMLRVDMPVGSGEPMYCTAVGKSLLIGKTQTELSLLFRDTLLERFTPNTITDIRSLVDDLQRSVDRGYTIDDEELHVGVRCLACPVRDHSGAVVAALGFSAPTSRFTRQRTAEFAAAVQTAAQEVSRQLGFSGLPAATEPV
jgi:DNA-binding IclR family transcriptional regulator